MPAEWIALKVPGTPLPLDLKPTGVTDEWEAFVNGEHRGYFTTEQVARTVVDAIFDGAPYSALVGEL